MIGCTNAVFRIKANEVSHLCGYTEHIFALEQEWPGERGGPMENADPNWDNSSITEVWKEGTRGIKLIFNLFSFVWGSVVHIYGIKDLKIC